MTTKVAMACVALVASLALGVSAALATGSERAADPGLTSTSILLGGTAPLTGPDTAYASIARGAEAYFRYVNARGGVLGRSIVYKVVDEGHNPAQSVRVMRRLVGQDKVFAVFNSFGPAQNLLAARDYLNAAKVPQLFNASGATTWGRDFAQHPFTIGFQPSYQAEGWVYGKYLSRTASGSRVAVLFQNDDSGKDLLNGLKHGMQRSTVKVIAAQPYESTTPDVGSQIAVLKASGADTLAIFATPRAAVQAFVVANRIGWRPAHVIVNGVAAASNVMRAASEGGANKLVDNAVSIAYLKDPAGPGWKADAAIKLYLQIMGRYAAGANVADVFHVYGMAVAWTMVQALRQAGKEPTRASLMEAVDTLNAPGNPFLLPGISVKTKGRDHSPIEQVLLQRWQKGSWSSFGGLWGYRAA